MQIKIFLASSLEELHTDRLEISSFILELNERLNEHDQYIKLFMCEDEDITVSHTRKQNDYNENISDSQLVIILFYKKVGEYTKEEFDVAYDHFKETGAPNIMVCFREEDNSEPSADIKELQYFLVQKGIYYKTYSDIDTVKLNILLWLLDYMSLNISIGGK